jgi:predicted transcriptional regulator YheO
MVDFLSKILGDDTEIVLHDLSNYKNSIVAIRNSHISGRKIGDAVTDLLLEMIHDGDLKGKKYLNNYKGYAKNGDILRSSTFLINNKKGKLIGALCINENCNMMFSLKDYLDKKLSFSGEKINDRDITETFNNNIDEYSTMMIKETIKEIGIVPERMSVEEKISIVNSLQEKGIFQLKGTVTQTAQELGISEPSVYRYINRLKIKTK